MAPERDIGKNIVKQVQSCGRTWLRDMNVTVSALDPGMLLLNRGAQLAIDVTLRNDLTAGGAPRTNAARVDGPRFAQARRDNKERKYQELVESERCLWVVVAIETGGRWSGE